jgi:hypothetical protein
VGLFLSGGIDSSSCRHSESGGIRLNTFSIIFARRDTAKRNTPARRRALRPNTRRSWRRRAIVDAIPYALKAMDQPTIDGLNTYLIARQTRAAGSKWRFPVWVGTRCSPATQPRHSSHGALDRFLGYWPSILRRPWARLFCTGLEYGPEPKPDCTRWQDKAIHPYFLAAPSSP